MNSAYSQLFMTRIKPVDYKLNVDIPQLPPFDSANIETFDWEDKVKALIEELKVKNQK